jgi:hypothetical protein
MPPNIILPAGGLPNCATWLLVATLLLANVLADSGAVSEGPVIGAVVLARMSLRLHQARRWLFQFEGR